MAYGSMLLGVVVNVFVFTAVLVGPPGYCEPHHKMPLDSRDEGS